MRPFREAVGCWVLCAGDAGARLAALLWLCWVAFNLGVRICPDRWAESLPARRHQLAPRPVSRCWVDGRGLPITVAQSCKHTAEISSPHTEAPGSLPCYPVQVLKMQSLQLASWSRSGCGIGRLTAQERPRAALLAHRLHSPSLGRPPAAPQHLHPASPKPRSRPPPPTIPLAAAASGAAGAGSPEPASQEKDQPKLLGWLTFQVRGGSGAGGGSRAVSSAVPRSAAPCPGEGRAWQGRAACTRWREEGKGSGIPRRLPDYPAPCARKSACTHAAPLCALPPQSLYYYINVAYWSLLLVSVITGNNILSKITHFEYYTTGGAGGRWYGDT